MNQIFKNHSALQSELFSHLCELTYRTGSWNNLFQYLLLSMSWPGSIKAFRSLSCNEITEQRGRKVCYSWLLQGTVAHCSFLWAHCRLWLPSQALWLCWGSPMLLRGSSCPALLKWDLGGPWIMDPPWWHSVLPCGLCQASRVGEGNFHRMCPWENTRQSYPSIKYTCLLWEGNGTEIHSLFTIQIDC